MRVDDPKEINGRGAQRPDKRLRTQLERRCGVRETTPIHLAVDGSSTMECDMGGIIGDIAGAVGGLFGGSGSSSGGGDFLSELLQAFEGNQGGSSGGGTMGEVGQIVGDVAPLLAAFL